MNSKSVTYLVIAVSSSFTVVVTAILAIYQLAPEFLGYPPKPVDSSELAAEAYKAKLDSIENEKLKYDTIFIEPKIALTGGQYDSIQQEFLRKDILQLQKDSLLKARAKLADSIARLNKKANVIKDSMRAVIDTFHTKSRSFNGLMDSLKRYMDMYNKTSSELKAANNKLKGKDDKPVPDSVKEKELKEYAKICNNSKPESVAKILENMKGQDASKILKLMDKKKAGKVLEAIKPEQAADILAPGKKP